MFKKLLFAFVAVVAGLFSCTSDEANVVQSIDTTPMSVACNVVEESEIGAEELFLKSMGTEADAIDADLYDRIKCAYENSYASLETAGPDSRAIVPALYKTARVEYTTTDEAGLPVTASALIVYPLFKKLTKVMLINHGTQVGFMMIPTGYTSVEGIMAATGALCIMPDYIGLGASKKHPDLYLNHDVHGRTSVDALLTLFDYAKKKHLPLDSNFKSYILGYSQGGSVSLASLRRVQELDAATQKSLHLEKVYCGDGPYDLRLTFESYMKDSEEGKTLGLGSVVPLVINSMFNSYPNELSDISYEDFFTPWALKTGVPQAIRANKEGVLDIVAKFYGQKFDRILNLDYCEAHPDHLERILQLMDRQNLCHGWKPQYRLKLLHCSPDGIVPFANFEEAYAGLNNEYMEAPKVVNINTCILSDPLLQHIYGMLVMMEDVLSGKM